MVQALTPASITALVARHGLRPSRALGQHFLADPNTARRIVRLAGVTASDAVLEIGPGIGSLTVALAETGAHVVALELDRYLLPVLDDVVGDAPNVEVAQVRTSCSGGTTEATEPIERTDPAEPMHRIEPAEPIDKIDPLDPMLRSEPADPVGRELSVFLILGFSHHWPIMLRVRAGRSAKPKPGGGGGVSGAACNGD